MTRVLVVPHGNIPSRWAHSLQAMKMAEALARRVDALTVLTRGSLLPSPLDRVDLRAWYGLQTVPRVRRLPLHLWVRTRSFSDVGRRRFDVAATAFALAYRPDLVLTRSLRAGLFLVRAGLPTVIETHAPPDSSAPVARRFARLSRLAHKDALRGVLTVTASLRDAFVSRGVPSDKVLVWPDAVDPQAFDAAPSAAQARAQLGWSAGPWVVYCGHLYEEKGVETLLAAARALPNVRFAVVGGWPADVERLEATVKDIQNITFTGFVANERVPLHLAVADVLVLPTSGRFAHARYTSPLKLFEYMAASRPIVASDLEVLRPVLQPERTAVLVPPDDPGALARALAALLAQPERAAQLARAAREAVRAHTWDARAAAVLERFLPVRGTWP